MRSIDIFNGDADGICSRGNRLPQGVLVAGDDTMTRAALR